MDNEVLDLLRQGSKGYHPLVSLLNLSEDIDASVTEKINCHKEIARYVLPQLKATETKLDINGELGVLKIVIDSGEEDDDEESKTLQYD